MDDAAELDRTLKELLYVEARLRELRAEAETLGKTLVVAGELLLQDPSRVRFEGETQAAAPAANTFPPVDLTHLEAERIRRLVERLREALAERDLLKQQVERLRHRIG